MDKKSIPHYGQLVSPVQKRGIISWTYRFSCYDSDFIRKCVQSLMELSQKTMAVFLVAANGTQKDWLPQLNGEKITNHPAFQGSLKGVRLVIRDPEQLMFHFTNGENTILIEADPVFSSDTLTQILDTAIYMALNKMDEQAEVQELSARISALKVVDQFEKELQLSEKSSAPQEKQQSRKKPNAKKIVRTILMVAALCAAWWFISKHCYETAVEMHNKGDYVSARNNYKIAFIYPGAMERAREVEKPAEYQLGSRRHEAATKALASGKYAAAKVDYEEAIKHFEKASGYSNADQRLENCKKSVHLCNAWLAYNQGEYEKAQEEALAAAGLYSVDTILSKIEKAFAFQEGTAFMEEKNYAAALTLLEKAGDHPDAQEKYKECCYHLGLAAKNAGNYIEAKEYFSKAGQYSDTQAHLLEISIPLGKSYVENGNFDEALELFTLASESGIGENDLKHYITLCNAEIAFREGKLKEGIGLFKAISGSFTPKEYDIEARREMLDGLDAFTKLEGEYGSSIYDIKYESYLYTHYYPEGVLKDMYLTIGCILEPDGTVSIKATASFYYFYEAPPVYGFGYEDKQKTVTFIVSGVSEYPSSITNGDTTLDLTGTYPKIDYKSGNATSKVTYNLKK